jgi:hypothetical protein
VFSYMFYCPLMVQGRTLRRRWYEARAESTSRCEGTLNREG